MLFQSEDKAIASRPAVISHRRVASAHEAASHGLVRMFGLDARAAVLAILIDLMVFAGDTFSLETLVPVGIAVAAVLGFIVYKMQRKYQNDDHESALIKAMIVGILTAIPVPLTPLIAIPSGIVGLASAIIRRRD